MTEKERDELLTMVSSSAYKNYSLRELIVGFGIIHLITAIIQIVLLLRA